MKVIASLYLGLATGAVLGGSCGAGYLVLTAACEGSTFDNLDLLLYMIISLPIGAAFGGFTGAFVGILRENRKS